MCRLMVHFCTYRILCMHRRCFWSVLNTAGSKVLKPGSALQIEGERMPHKEEKTRKGTIFETGWPTKKTDDPSK